MQCTLCHQTIHKPTDIDTGQGPDSLYISTGNDITGPACDIKLCACYASEMLQKRVRPSVANADCAKTVQDWAMPARVCRSRKGIWSQDFVAFILPYYLLTHAHSNSPKMRRPIWAVNSYITLQLKFQGKKHNIFVLTAYGKSCEHSVFC